MAALNKQPIIVDKINGNVRRSMQDMHYAMFNNKRKSYHAKKSLKYNNNFEVNHHCYSTTLHSRRMFDYIKKTTNNILNKNELWAYKIDNLNERRVIIKFNQINCFNPIDKSKLAKRYKKRKDATILMRRCISMVYYVRKDTGINGGNFPYYKCHRSYRFSIKNTFEGDVIVYKGDLIHSDDYVYGIGCFDTITVFIPLYEYVPFTTMLYENYYLNLNGIKKEKESNNDEYVFNEDTNDYFPIISYPIISLSC